MSKLLFLFESDMPTVSIARDVFTNLSDERIKSNFMYIFDVEPEDINSHDVIVFIRPENVYSWKIAKMARDAGHVTITFCDDDLLNRPKTLPRIPWRRRGLIRALNNSDIIWSSSPYILKKYVQLTGGKRIAHSDTIVIPAELNNITTSNTNNKKVKIVYAAGGDHAALFEKYIKPIIPDLFSEYGDVISFTFVGVHPNMDGYDSEYISAMPLLEYRNYMKRQQFDIGLAPLDEDNFSKCKYFNKFVEYTLQGIAGIYSNTEPYTYVVRDGENGFLANNRPEDWLKAMKSAINNVKLRESCVKNAVAYLYAKHTETAILEQISKEIPEIVEEGRKYSNCGEFKLQKIIYLICRPLDWLYLTIFYLKHTGLGDVIDRAKRKLTGRNVYDRRREK